jgi:acetyl-CoA acetyltransferase
MTRRDFDGKVAVAGVGNTAFGALYRNLDAERSPYELGAEAFVNALDDAGLKKTDIDGVLVCRIPSYTPDRSNQTSGMMLTWIASAVPFPATASMASMARLIGNV